ncbi:DUF7619 domain-containing protein [Psychroserpens jangbogonensis]|uniref:T9SS type A sorting domain-containing protein n=1 Tax=Psychroserpens jangbogonensis TaxID=1484460 RepID=UPI00053D4FD6|nr:T9SS type A sorting domain-containing protein [Psychroserpens jangbogonensis]
MKNYYIFLVTLLISFTINAQIIDFPDANLKNALVNTNCVSVPGNANTDADTNEDGEIEVSEALAITTGLFIQGQSISSLEGIENFANLTALFVDNNQISTFDFSWLPNLSNLSISNNLFTFLDVNNAPNLMFLECSNNQLTSLDFINAPNLRGLECLNNQLTSLLFGNSSLLDILECSDNELTSLDIGDLEVTELYCTNNPNLTSLELSLTLDFLTLANIGISELDVSELQYMTHFSCQINPNLTSVQLGGDNYDDGNYYIEGNPILETISFKNGLSNYDGFEYSSYSICNNPNLTFVCADENEIESWTYTIDEGGDIITIYVDGVQQIVDNCGYTNVTVSPYCTFNPGGDNYFIEGNTTLDLDSNGCDSNDIFYPNLNFEITTDTETRNFIANASGDYSIPVGEGAYILTPSLDNPTYFSVTPSSLVVDFPTDESPFTQDFCIAPIGTFNDLEITIIPLELARPGFDTHYTLMYKNKGTTVLSGSVDLTFEDDLMDLVFATPTEDAQSPNQLTWNFNDLEPFESRNIDFIMNLNSPMETPPVNGGEVLVFEATINSSETDETPDDNTSTLNQTVVNSYDPNDKTCLEGNFITPEMVGNFVHYMIRFENTGTASAVNIVVKDDIDRTKYDISTLIPLNASHDYVARIQNNATDNYVEFIFENINLPFDDANNDGYIVFKIKTLDTLALNDTFENDAEIYFDFNFPIVTNNEQTTIATLSTEDFQLSNNSILLYPNPTTNHLILESKQAINHISIYDISGRLINEIAVIGSKTNVNISTEDLSSGTYFVKIKTNQGKIVQKVIKD